MTCREQLCNQLVCKKFYVWEFLQYAKMSPMSHWQWPNGSKRFLLLTKSNATKGKPFFRNALLELWSVLWHSSWLNFEGFCDTVRPNLRIAKLVSCVHLLPLLLLGLEKTETPKCPRGPKDEGQKWERNKIEAKVWIGKLVSTWTTENTCLERLGEISQTSNVFN